MTQLMEQPIVKNGNGGIARQRQTVMGSLADRYQMDPAKLLETMKATCIKGNATNEQVQAFCIVANRYGLDPFLKEIHAFAAQGGGIVPIVGIDGWSKIANADERFDGCEFSFDGAGDEMSCTCTVFVKNRAHPVKITEYLRECKRNTPPWNTYTRRMLRHKTFIQCVRIAFGLGGIFDEDEARDILNNVDAVPSEPTGSRTAGLLKKITSRPVDSNQTFEPTPDALNAAEQDESPDPPQYDPGPQADAPAATSPPADEAPTTPAPLQAPAGPGSVDAGSYEEWCDLAQAAAQDHGVSPSELVAGINRATLAKGCKGDASKLPPAVRARLLTEIVTKTGYFKTA